jgi:hypothetical protein
LTIALQIGEDARKENSIWHFRSGEVKDEDYRFKTWVGIHNALAIFLHNAGRTGEAVLHYKKAVKLITLSGDVRCRSCRR